MAMGGLMKTPQWSIITGQCSRRITLKYKAFNFQFLEGDSIIMSEYKTWDKFDHVHLSCFNLLFHGHVATVVLPKQKWQSEQACIN